MHLTDFVSRRNLVFGFSATVLTQCIALTFGYYLRVSIPASDFQANLEDRPCDSEAELIDEPAGSEFPNALINESAITTDPETSATADSDEIEASEEQLRLITHKVSSGDTLSRIWANYGASHQGSLLAAQALRKAGFPVTALRVSETLEIQLSESADILSLKRKLGDGKELILEGDSELGYTVRVVEPDIVEKRRQVSGVIRSSFSSAARQLSVPSCIVDELVDLFGGRIEFNRNLQPGDTFSIVYTERRTSSGDFLKPGPIRAASLVNSDKLMLAFRYVADDGTVSYYDESGSALGSYFLRYPLKFTRISSVFTQSRFHPVLKRHRPHNGVDFAAPSGTPVRAIADGIIEYAGYNGGGGNTIKIQHNSRYATAYMHLARIDTDVRRGQRVTRGQMIGTVGQTGLATGPHLHFSLYDRGRYIDPLKADLPKLNVHQAALPGRVLKAVLKRAKRSHATVRLAALRAKQDMLG